MLMVLRSLSRSDAPGMREWSLANGLAIVALPLYGGRGVIPDVLSIELANLLFLCVPMLMYAGYLRYLERRVPAGLLAAGLGATTVLLLLFHYVVDSMPIRIVVTSVAHGAVYVALACSLHRAEAPAASRYARRFAFWVAVLLALALTVRALVYAARYDVEVEIFEVTALNLACFALGTLSLPALTMGAVMMANADLLGRTTYAAEHDHLTGAWSRRAFFALAGRELERAQRNRSALSVLVFDIDHFKAINDTYGHGVGDRVLADIVGCTGTVIRAVDLCARLGGEEFAVLLPDTTPERARVVAQRLREALQQSATAAAGGRTVRYTASIGLACLESGESLDRLLQRADAALYAAKAGGRNRVCEADTATGSARAP